MASGGSTVVLKIRGSNLPGREKTAKTHCNNWFMLESFSRLSHLPGVSQYAYYN